MQTENGRKESRFKSEIISPVLLAIVTLILGTYGVRAYIENYSLTRDNANLQEQVKQLKQENVQLQSKILVHADRESILSKYELDPAGLYVEKNSGNYYCLVCLLTNHVETPLSRISYTQSELRKIGKDHPEPNRKVTGGVYLACPVCGKEYRPFKLIEYSDEPEPQK